jgi:hypothetical protein
MNKQVKIFEDIDNNYFIGIKDDSNDSDPIPLVFFNKGNLISTENYDLLVNNLCIGVKTDFLETIPDMLK